MSTLYLIRHGQAGKDRPVYDQLSDLGWHQSRLLGQWLVEREISPARVYVGPRRRHQETCQAVSEAWQGASSPAWPDPIPLPDLDEYPVLLLMQSLTPEIFELEPRLTRWAAQVQAGGPDKSRAFMRILETVSFLWMDGTLAPEGIETWLAFRARIRRGLETMTEAQRAAPGETVLAFTSGGSVGAATGTLTDAPPRRTMELSWVVRNASMTEVRFTQGRRSLVAFNTTPHLPTPELWTFR